MSLAQTTAKSQRTASRPCGAASTQMIATQGSAIHSVPRAAQNGTRTPVAIANRHTTAAPSKAIAIPVAAAPTAAAITDATAVAMIAPCPLFEEVPVRRAHSQPIPAAPTATSTEKNGGPAQAAASASGAITSAEAMRSFKLPEGDAVVRRGAPGAAALA